MDTENSEIGEVTVPFHGLDGVVPMREFPKVRPGMTESEALLLVLCPRLGMTHLEARLAMNERLPKPRRECLVRNHTWYDEREGRVAFPNDRLKLSILLDDVLHVGEDEIEVLGLSRRFWIASATRAVISGLCDGVDRSGRSGDFPPKSWLSEGVAKRVSKVQSDCVDWFLKANRKTAESIRTRMEKASDEVLRTIHRMAPEIRKAAGMAVVSAKNGSYAENGGDSLWFLRAGVEEFSKVLKAVSKGVGKSSRRSGSRVGALYRMDCGRRSRERRLWWHELCLLSEFIHRKGDDFMRVMTHRILAHAVRVGRKWEDEAIGTVRKVYLEYSEGMSARHRHGSGDPYNSKCRLVRAVDLIDGRTPPGIVSELRSIIDGIHGRNDISGKIQTIVGLFGEAVSRRLEMPLEEAFDRVARLMGSCLSPQDKARELAECVDRLSAYGRTKLLSMFGNRLVKASWANLAVTVRHRRAAKRAGKSGKAGKPKSRKSRKPRKPWPVWKAS